ncbi:hypothetical protein CGL51_08410 [Pyrobaculum aerophilum]|uniref:PaRep2b domain-containing protein n=2 Tax=Pyrobaculum aerophilum TaxID=13773 RepID=A0A371QXA7_9CREN|nr:hypothetical protein CGL51_08410 [Pyrobaculum aerophilum]
MAKNVAIGALPTDVVLYPGIKYVEGSTSYLSQALTYWALAEGRISLGEVYPSVEGLKVRWRIQSNYSEIVDEILKKGYTVFDNLKGNINLKTAFTDVEISDELKIAFEKVAEEFWERAHQLLKQWEEAEKSGNVNLLNKLGKYLRVLLPLAYAVEAYKRGELSREDIALAVIFAVLYDGSISKGEIRLYVGGPEKEEEPIMTHDHFTAFWLWALKELGLKPSALYPGRNEFHIVFRGDEMDNLMNAFTLALPKLYELSNALTEFADAFRIASGEVVRSKFGVDWAYDVKEESFLKKLNKIIAITEDYIRNNVTVDKRPLDTSGQRPKAVIRLKLGGEVVARINMYWTDKVLHAQFAGSREKAERLASILRALGSETKTKHTRRIGWVVWLTTDGIIAIRHDGWLKAVKSFVDELKDKKLISEDRYKQLVRDIEAGPNTVKFAGVEFSVNYDNKVLVSYNPRNEISKNTAVDALRARGLKEGVHFTVTERGGYEIRVADKSYAKAVGALAQSGLREKEHYAVDGKKHVIYVKKKNHKDAIINALKAAGLEEGKDFAVKGVRYVIRITYEGLREIQRMALNGDLEAEKFIRELDGVLRRRHGDDAVKKLIEVLTPVREEGALEIPLPVYDEKGNLIARIVDLRYEFVKDDQSVDQCAGEDCRLRIIVEYETQEEKRQLKMEWSWAKRQKKRSEKTVTYYYEKRAMVYLKNEVEVAVLKTLTGKAKKGKVYLFTNELNALRRFKPLKDAIDQWREEKPAAQHTQGQKAN